MPHAAVVKLAPLEVDDLVDFLTDPAPRRRTVWAPVHRALRAQPSGVLAEALSSPLLAALAKEAFLIGEPAELLELTSAGAIGRRLIDRFIEVAYSIKPAGTEGFGAPALRTYEPDDAVYVRPPGRHPAGQPPPRLRGGR